MCVIPFQIDTCIVSGQRDRITFLLNLIPKKFCALLSWVTVVMHSMDGGLSNVK